MIINRQAYMNAADETGRDEARKTSPGADALPFVSALERACAL